LGTWIAGARPATLALSVVPVALGTAAAAQVMVNWYDHWVRALLCLAVAVFLQIGVNYANDYSDGVRGTDRDRVGPQRLVGSGRAKPRTVLTVALVFFALAAVAGAVLVWRTEQWWLLAVGAVCLIAGWFYTGGKRPYGYLGLGELAVFVFFGIVPTAGTMFVQVLDVNIEAWLAGAAAGFFAAAVLVANNARDRERDKVYGKRTLAVLLGEVGTRILYVVLMLLPFGILAFFALFYEPGSGSGFAPYVYFAGVGALPAILIATTARTAREWVLVMKLTLVTTLLFGLGLAAAIVLPGALL
jgi:1,4-dihydroxy-2-naphthoate octaprenyltransferase